MAQFLIAQCLVVWFVTFSVGDVDGCSDEQDGDSATELCA